MTPPPPLPQAIAVVTTSYPRFAGDPSGHFVATEVRALRAQGDAVVVFAPDGGAFGWPGFEARVRGSPLRLLGAAAWTARARWAIGRGGFDRVVAHWAVPSGWPIACAGRGGARLELVSHGGDVRLLARLPPGARARIASRLAARAERWRFVSAPLRDALLARLPGDVARAVEAIAAIAPCAIDVEAPEAARVAAKRAEVGAPFVVCVARLVPGKRVEAAIAWAGARGVPLVVVGDGPARASLERRARAEGGRVIFAGRTTRAEALAWIAASEGLVQASREEGWSTVEREAIALGVGVTRVS